MATVFKMQVILKFYQYLKVLGCCLIQTVKSTSKPSTNRKDHNVAQYTQENSEESFEPTCFVCLDLRVINGLVGKWHGDLYESSFNELSHTFTWTQMVNAASTGCANCQIILGGLQLMRENIDLLWNENFQREIILSEETPLEVEIELNLENDRDREDSRAVRFQFYTNTDNHVPDWSPYRMARLVPSAISVANVSDLVRSWIENYDINHSTCTVKDNQHAKVPTRLLDLEGADRDPICLVDSYERSLSPNTRYATLSHCWGDPREAKPFRTLSSNLKNNKAGIAWDSLSKTFQDAIMIVRALDIRYIWIDSLCIVQDNLDDWSTEASRMASVYCNSYLNIAATGSTNSNGGCLMTRKIQQGLQSFPPESYLVGIIEGQNVYVRPSLKYSHYRFLNKKPYRSLRLGLEIDRVPLLSRAWVYRELCLARRTLHFHPAEIVLECKSGLRCECTGMERLQSAMGLDHAPTTENTAELYDSWLETISTYSKLHLSNETDRLPALAGVATVFQGRIKCRYLAGLWENDLWRGLMWSATRYSSHVNDVLAFGRTKMQEVPSWSWASVELKVEGSFITFIYNDSRVCAIDSRLRLEGTNIPGEAPSSMNIPYGGFIQVNGLVATAIADTSDRNRWQMDEMILLFDIEVDDMIIIYMDEMRADVTWANGCSPPVKCGATVKCLLVASSIFWEERFKETNPSQREEVPVKHDNIIVLRKSPVFEECYERVGMWSIRQDFQLFKRG